MTIDPTRDECRENCRGSWNWHNGNPCFHRSTYEDKSWVRNPWSSRIRYKGYVFPFLQELDNAFHLRKSTMRMKWEEPSSIFDIIISEELSSDSSIFTGYVFGFFQSTYSTERDIFEISDWCRYYWEHEMDCRETKKKSKIYCYLLLLILHTSILIQNYSKKFPC